MPGARTPPQAMTFDPARRAFVAQGIPITPRDDSGANNPYPVMRLVARGDAGAELASTNVVLPVSDEMDCRACHGSGTAAQAMPAGGWANDPDPDRDDTDATCWPSTTTCSAVSPCSSRRSHGPGTHRRD